MNSAVPPPSRHRLRRLEGYCDSLYHTGKPTSHEGVAGLLPSERTSGWSPALTVVYFPAEDLQDAVSFHHDAVAVEGDDFDNPRVRSKSLVDSPLNPVVSPAIRAQELFDDCAFQVRGSCQTCHGLSREARRGWLAPGPPSFLPCWVSRLQCSLLTARNALVDVTILF